MSNELSKITHLYPYLNSQHVTLEECFNKSNDSSSQFNCRFCEKGIKFNKTSDQEASKHLTRCKEFLKIYNNHSVILRQHLGLSTILQDKQLIQFTFASPAKIFVHKRTGSLVISQSNLDDPDDVWEELAGRAVKKMSFLNL